MFHNNKVTLNYLFFVCFQVEFIDFALEFQSDCNYDYLELFNGPNASYPSIGKFCGTMPLKRFTSQSNSARIVFSTDSRVSARGFKLTYTFSAHDIIYMGCYQDSGNRILADYNHVSHSNSPTECSKHCSRYKYFGVEEWKHCLCGNTLNSAIKALESECREICPGDRSQRCGAYWRINLYRHWDCPLGSYSANCSKQCHCLEGPCDVVTGACGNGGCKDGWKGIACNENCPLGSYSANCSKQCHCLEGPCDVVTGACGNGGCKDGWKGIACNETKEDTIIWISSTVSLCLVVVVTIVCVYIRKQKRRRAPNDVQLNQLQSSNNPQGRRAPNDVQLNQLQSSNNSQGRRAPNDVQLNQLQSSKNPQGRRAQNDVRLNQLPSSNSTQVRKYDMQVETQNAEDKEEENDNNEVENSSDFLI
ncbi:cell death abnormality protein 1-like isoform X3 [Dreissena polymorpha]|uniref:cell death abnormality protein 1-like isoform X2 n=1 Tax=Dreissena polymorpha TaxID=45954 RepID=UPI002263F6C0|nr:cell death abnormality protein 1-like isoform X2 [Dreissena polymorpha]XP_052276537.1 cell death abnormality protein 1-like isoform X3 [Dreissena polymorpha]